MAITNAYNHIKQVDPQMEVIMWGDMLDPYWNGAKVNKNTSGAIDLIPQGLIIADWRYASNRSYRYESTKEIFPSVGEFINKGFRVWPTSWNEVKASIDLVWTGNMEQARTGKVMGHLYSTWLGGVVPELKMLISDPNYHAKDNVISGISQADKPKHRQYYRSIADSINATSNIIGIKQCRGTDYYCGDYPNCEDSTQKSGYFGSEFRRYFCSNNQSVYNVINFPNDYIGYWKFDSDATDVSGQNGGVFFSGATITNDSVRGQVVSFAAINDCVKVKANNLQNIGKGSLSISAWFKAGSSTTFGVIVSKNPSLTNYTLLLHQDGRVLLETNGNKFFRYTQDGISYRDNKWHHVVAIFDSNPLVAEAPDPLESPVLAEKPPQIVYVKLDKTELGFATGTNKSTINLYIDGVISNGTAMFLHGNNEKSGGSDLFIGNNNGSGQYQFQGLIDDLMLFNRALSLGEVKMLYLSKK
jgi:hypothetical protein